MSAMLVLADAPQLLIALEQSTFASTVRQSAWAYPLANVGHILALTLFAGAVAVMDLRLLGAFRTTVPAAVVRPARTVAMLGLGLLWRSRRSEPRPWRADDRNHYERRSAPRERR